MNNKALVEYYVSLKSILRLENFLENNSIIIPENIKKYVSKLHDFLSGQEAPHKELDKLIEQQIKDEQDLGYEEMLYQQYLYALSDFLFYFAEENIMSLTSSSETVIESYRYVETNKYLLENGLDAVEWNDSDEERIENSPLVLTEKNIQKKDRLFAEKLFT